MTANCGDCAAVLCRAGVAVPLSTAHVCAPGSSEAARVLAAGGWITSEMDLCVGRLHAMDLEDPEISGVAHERVRLNEIHRVCGEVAVTRAIGDVDFKGWSKLNESLADDGDDGARAASSIADCVSSSYSSSSKGLLRPPVAGIREPPCFAYPEGHCRRFTRDLLVATPEIVSRDLDHLDEFCILASDGLWDVIDPHEAVLVAAKFLDSQLDPKAVADRLVDRALKLGSGDNITVLVIQLKLP